MKEYWDWLEANQQDIALDGLMAFFIIAVALMLYQFNWRWAVAWLRTDAYNWLKKVWGQYALPIRWYKKWRRTHEKRIGEQKALTRFWTDILCQAGENAVHSGQFSREQIDKWYSLFGKKADLISLLPKQLARSRKDQRHLKGAILKRIGPETRQVFKEKNGKPKTVSAKNIRYQFKRAFRNTDVAA